MNKINSGYIWPRCRSPLLVHDCGKFKIANHEFNFDGWASQYYLLFLIVSDSGSNKIAPGTGIDKNTKIKSNRNVVIAKKGFAGGDADRRRCLASPENKKRDVTDRLRSNVRLNVYL